MNVECLHCERVFDEAECDSVVEPEGNYDAFGVTLHYASTLQACPYCGSTDLEDYTCSDERHEIVVKVEDHIQERRTA